MSCRSVSNHFISKEQGKDTSNDVFKSNLLFCLEKNSQIYDFCRDLWNHIFFKCEIEQIVQNINLYISMLSSIIRILGDYNYIDGKRDRRKKTFEYQVIIIFECWRLRVTKSSLKIISLLFFFTRGIQLTQKHKSKAKNIAKKGSIVYWVGMSIV